MLWLKRNLYLALAIAAAVVLTGSGGYVVWTKKAQNDSLDERLKEYKAKLDHVTDPITGVKPAPTPQNLAAIQADLDRAREFQKKSKPIFSPTPYQPLNSQGFKSLLESTLSDLRKQAALANVRLPTNFYFSFEAETRPMTFEGGSIRPLAEQLYEIAEMSRAFFRASVSGLDMVRRVAVSQYDNNASEQEILPETYTTNRWTGLSVWPYEFTIECFPGQLAAALEEISKIPRMYIIKKVYLETLQPTGKAFGVEAPNRGAAMAAPPWRPGRGGVPPKAAAAAPVLDERMCRVTLLIHVIKPVPVP